MAAPDDGIATDASAARLIVSHGEKEIATHPISQRQILIGRRMDCDIRIDCKNASRHHAQIFKVLHDAYVLDLDSKNGTFVNGRRVAKHALRNGDVISIGNFRLRYVQPES
ncbi:MAG: FHA domain-containing protein [Pseudomonadota bacterium]